MNIKRPKICCSRSHHYLSSWLNEDSIVVDLGANRGLFSADLADRFGCQCFSVEAVPYLFAAIPDHSKIKKFNFAIASKEGTLEFALSSQPESGSLYELPTAMHEGTISVEAKTLSQFLKENSIKSVDLLKVDIEGAEIDLLESADTELLNKIRQITVEFHDFLPYFKQGPAIRRIKSKLAKAGFACIPYSLRFNADVVFVKRSDPDFQQLVYLYLKYCDRYLRAIGRHLSAGSRRFQKS